MAVSEFNEQFWERRYADGETGWDIGYVSSPLKAYFDQLDDKNIKILVPGGGNSYEAEYLYKAGFANVYVADIAKPPLDNLKRRCPEFPDAQLLHSNFFDLEATFDLIVEQTFFCALHPFLRKTYAQKMSKLLNPNGKLAGVLFDAELNADRPPFGGHKQEYLTYFEPLFKIRKMERCYNSIPQRQGRELFVMLEKYG